MSLRTGLKRSRRGIIANLGDGAADTWARRSRCGRALAQVLAVCPLFLSVFLIAAFTGFANVKPAAASDAGRQALIVAYADEPSETELERAQADADYTKEIANPDVHLFDYLALALGLSVVLIWFFCPDLVLRVRGDILPWRIKMRLDGLEARRLAIAASVFGLTSAEPDGEWPEERRRYDAIAASANALLETVRQGLKLDSIDENSVIFALDRLLADAESLTARLASLAPGPVPAAERVDVDGLSRIQRINRSWERVFAKRELSRLVTLSQLSAMGWPNWSRLASAAR
ncbi:hypothetical protein [Methylocapsa acidiphila]|uniref:hypothetical protein n=1 Tax=Methylocapsa acidiphila TaxID=133552 RepID=UPI0004190A79|nr:hypothetical protein [Methylocapsa acidiphila]